MERLIIDMQQCLIFTGNNYVALATSYTLNAEVLRKECSIALEYCVHLALLQSQPGEKV
jgi:hypothetical protein